MHCPLSEIDDKYFTVYFSHSLEYFLSSKASEISKNAVFPSGRVVRIQITVHKLKIWILYRIAGQNRH